MTTIAKMELEKLVKKIKTRIAKNENATNEYIQIKIETEKDILMDLEYILNLNRIYEEE